MGAMMGAMVGAGGDGRLQAAEARGRRRPGGRGGAPDDACWDRDGAVAGREPSPVDPAGGDSSGSGCEQQVARPARRARQERGGGCVRAEGRGRGHPTIDNM